MSQRQIEIGLRKATIRLGQCDLDTRHGRFAVHFFRDLAHGESAMAIVCGGLDGSSPLLARVHSSCLTSECLSGRDCDCAAQLDGALAMMAHEGAGVLFYLMQEGRGAGLTAKARDRMMVQASGNRKTTFEAYAEMGLPPDLRRYDAVAVMSRLLDIRAPLRLLTNNPDKAAAVAKALADEQLEVCRTESIHGPISAFNSDYLCAKHDSGHALDRPVRIRGALPPMPVRIHPPVVLRGEPNRILTASYFLPVALPASTEGDSSEVVVDWFRLSVIFDCETARESIVLAHPRSTAMHVVATTSTHRQSGDADERVSMSLLDRLPIGRAPGREALERILLGIRARGCGSVTVAFDDCHRAEP
jgi:3,4-dihydroxy 2-butanone 4-phosphate synthase/GTP cyclohydrolase II